MIIPEGAIVAMLTPFDDKGRINEAEVRKFVSFLISKKVDGIFPVASCGEYVHMDMEERKFLIDVVIDEAAKRVPVIPGTGATCYHQSIELADYAKQKGCAAVVLHGPYFFKNSEDAVEGHIRKVAESVDIPIFVYNIPLFANEVTPVIVEKLAEMPNIVGIKDSSGSMINIMNLLEMTKKIKPDFKVLVGVEEMMFPALLMGARGSMTDTAGILPEFLVGIWNAFNDGNLNRAYNLQFAILPIIREMKSFNFPQGFKEALFARGINPGPPKMNYSSESLTELFSLRERLRLEIDSLIENYFNSKVVYDEIKANKFIYPSFEVDFLEKKYIDCIMCGMCTQAKAINKNYSNSIISRDKIEQIVADTVRKIVNASD